MSETLLANGSTWVDPDDWDGDTIPDLRLDPEEPAVENDELEALFL
jgi:hypothetical protein